ncbi:hypothetical protein DRN52_05070 [Thermococci archaeon]|nr:MAG: hypothetical protein DRN52_05070 [Thermococci archaeon]
MDTIPAILEYRDSLESLSSFSLRLDECSHVNNVLEVLLIMESTGKVRIKHLHVSLYSRNRYLGSVYLSDIDVANVSKRSIHMREVPVGGEIDWVAKVVLYSGEVTLVKRFRGSIVCK